jgi:hypothetical protein
MDMQLVDGVTLDTLEKTEDPYQLKMIAFESDIISAGFDREDKSLLKIYHYIRDSVAWELVGGSISGDTVIANTNLLGTFGLGIAIEEQVDLIAPNITDFSPNPNTSFDEMPIISLQAIDDRFGSGLDFSSCLIILNGDTLNLSYDPSENIITALIDSTFNYQIGQYVVKYIVADFAGNQSTETIQFNLTSTSITTNSSAELYISSFPNPFREHNTIQFVLEKPSIVEINIYDMQGKFIKSLGRKRCSAGLNEVTWHGLDNSGNKLNSGIYFYQIMCKDYNIIRKIIIE